MGQCPVSVQVDYQTLSRVYIDTLIDTLLPLDLIQDLIHNNSTIWKSTNTTFAYKWLSEYDTSALHLGFGFKLDNIRWLLSHHYTVLPALGKQMQQGLLDI